MGILDNEPCLYCGLVQPYHAVSCVVAPQLLVARTAGIDSEQQRILAIIEADLAVDKALLENPTILPLPASRFVQEIRTLEALRKQITK